MSSRGTQAPPGLGRATRTMAVATAVSRLTGFARSVVLVAAIGLGLVGDAYNTANTLPIIVYELLVGGVLSSVIVPLLVHARVRDADDGVAYTQRLLSLLTVVLLAATGLAILAAPLLTYAYGIRDDPEQVALATMLARILLVEILFLGLSAMLGAVLNSRQVFGPPAWAPVLNNLVVIATGVVFIGLNNAGELTTATISPGLVWLLGIGTTLGIVVQALALLPAMHRAGVRWAWRWDWRHAGLAEAGRLGLWVIGYVAVSQVGYLVIMALANAAGRASGVGSIVYANASLLFQLPYGIIGVALLTALLPRMSKAAAEGDSAAVVRDLSLGARLTAVALIPISGLLIVLGPAIATVAFARGQVDLAQARAVGVVLAASAFGLLPYAVTLLQLRVFYAMKDARTPTLINLGMVAVRVPLCLLTPVLLPTEHIVTGLAVANSLSFVVGAVVGDVWLRRRMGRLETGRVLRTAGLLTLASAVGALAAWGVASAVESLLGRGQLGSAAAVLAGSLVGGVTMLAGCLVLPVPEVRELAAVVRRRFGKGRREKASQVESGKPAEGTAGGLAEPDSGQPVMVGERYRLLARSGGDEDTGAGRLSTWRARDTLLQRDVILRIHAPGGSAARGFLDRALAAGVLSHPALAMVYDAVDENRRAYVVGEWVTGTSLADKLHGGPLAEPEARETVRRVAEGVAQAHQLGLAVGGLTPDRVILTPTGSVTVVAIPAPLASREADVRDLGALLFATMAGFLPVDDDVAELDRQLTNAEPDLADVALAALGGHVPSAADMVSQLLAGRRHQGHRHEDSGLAFITDRYEYDTDVHARAVEPVDSGWPTSSDRSRSGADRSSADYSGGDHSDPEGFSPGHRDVDRSASERSNAEPPGQGSDADDPSDHTRPIANVRAALAAGAAGAAMGATAGSDEKADAARRPRNWLAALPLLRARRHQPAEDGQRSAEPAGDARDRIGAGAGKVGGSTLAVPAARPGDNAPPPPDSDASEGGVPLSPVDSVDRPEPGTGTVGLAAVPGVAASVGTAAPGRAAVPQRDDAGVIPRDQATTGHEERVDDHLVGGDDHTVGSAEHHTVGSADRDYPPAWLQDRSDSDDDDGADDEAHPDRRRRTWLVLAFPVAALLAVALIGWAIGLSFNDMATSPTGQSSTAATTPPASSTTPAPTTTPAPSAALLTVVSATVYDPFGDGEPENDDESPLAFDGDPGSSWSTLTYRGSASLGNLKPGVGLVFDLGRAAVVSEVTIATGQPGAQVELRSGAQPAGDLEAFLLLGQSQLTPQTVIPVESGQPARYWLVWVTELVPDDGDFSASLAEVAFTGVPAL